MEPVIHVGGKDSIINGAKDILKAALLALLTILAYMFLVHIMGAIMFYIAVFLLLIAGILALIGVARILLGIVTL